MNNLLPLLIEAKRKFIFQSQSEFRNALNEIQQYDKKLILDWDDGAGEDWARFGHDQHGIVYMIHSKIGIVFARESYFRKIPREIISKYKVHIVKNYDNSEWFVNLKELNSTVPEISWSLLDNCVDSNKFSLLDLYFETV